MSEDEILWVDETIPATVERLWNEQHRTQLDDPLPLRDILNEIANT